MCPDKKLKWFKDHGHTAAQIRDIKKMVIERWDETYKGENSEGLPPAPAPRRGKVRFNLCCQILDLLYFLFRPSPSRLLQQNLRRIKIQILLLLIWLIQLSGCQLSRRLEES